MAGGRQRTLLVEGHGAEGRLMTDNSRFSFYTPQGQLDRGSLVADAEDVGGNIASKDELSVVDSMRGFCAIEFDTGTGNELPPKDSDWMSGTSNQVVYMKTITSINGRGAEADQSSAGNWGIRISAPGAWFIAVSFYCTATSLGAFNITTTKSGKYGSLSPSFTGLVALNYTDLLIIETPGNLIVPSVLSSGAWHKGSMKLVVYRVDNGAIGGSHDYSA